MEYSMEVPNPKNLSKLYEARQESKESPSAFYERLHEVAKRWTDFDPEEAAGQGMFGMLFVGQL